MLNRFFDSILGKSPNEFIANLDMEVTCSRPYRNFVRLPLMWFTAIRRKSASSCIRCLRSVSPRILIFLFSNTSPEASSEAIHTPGFRTVFESKRVLEIKFKISVWQWFITYMVGIEKVLFCNSIFKT